MEKNAELVRLEQFVDTLLNKYNDLKNSFHALESTLKERNDECAALKNDISELKNDRSEVGSRVSELLYRIELWEAEQDDLAQKEDVDEKQGSFYEADGHGNGELS